MAISFEEYMEKANKARTVVACGAGSIRLLVVQIPGKKAVPVADFLRGHRVVPRDRMGA